MKKYCLLLIYTLLCVSFSAKGAQDDYVFRTFSPQGGFYYDGVKAIQQDKAGFIWILMDNDLFRFDGYQYKRYYTNFPGWEESADWCFNNIVADALGRIWVATNDGLYCYNKEADSFIRLLDTKVEYVETDPHGNIWIRESGELGIFDVETKTTHYPLLEGEKIKTLRNIFCSYNNDLYLFSNYGKIFRFDNLKKELILCHRVQFDKGPVVDAVIKKGKLWLLVQKEGLYKIDLSSFLVEKVIKTFDLEDNPLRKLYIDKNETIWIGSMKGLFVLNPDNYKFTHYTHSKLNKFSLPNNSIWTIVEDKQKNLWIGTYSGGLCYVDVDEKAAFTTYTPQDLKLNHAPVSSFAEDADNLWIATEGGGLNRQNKSTGGFTYYLHEPNTNSLIHNNVKSLVVDKDKNVWIGSFSGGLDCYDTKQNSFRNLKHERDNPKSLLTNYIRKICLAGDSGLWIAYQQKKLIISYYSFKDKLFTHYPFNSERNGQYIFDMIQGRNNQLWMLSHRGLYVMNTQDKSIKKVPLKDSLNLSGQSLCMDDSGNIWIGTIGRGLIKYDPTTSTYTSYREILDHNMSSIYSICYDNEGYLWIGTDNGLFRYNIANNNFLRFDQNDGAQGLIYYPQSSMKGLDGKIYFGGTSGFTVVNPKWIAENKYKPNVIISEFYIDNVSVKRYGEKFSEETKEIVLNYDQTNFGFKFSSDNYLMPKKSRFKYKLKGYDNDWIETDASSRVAVYSKVPAGTYYLEIMVANNDGLWNDVPTVIKIERKAAPWLTWWAYLFYIMLASGIVYTLLHYYNGRKKLKMQLYLENIEKDKKDQIHASQLRFFTNISHDFRTPLSLLIAATNRLREEGLKEYYYRILNGNSQRLLNLVNELMDFRTVENGQMTLQLESFDVNDFVEKVSFDFIDYAKQRNIDFKIMADQSLPTSLYADRYVVEKVVMNLLNNAFKYSNDGATISIETHSSQNPFHSQYKHSYTVKGEKEGKELTDFFSIVVHDSGIGISKESIANVFDRFYKVKTVNFDSHLGTGIGLALVRSLALLHKGTITIYSERDKGTDMLVCFPMNTDIYNEDEFLAKESNIQSNNAIEEDDFIEDLDVEPHTISLNKKKILLAEDNDDLRTLIAQSLSDNYDVIEAVNGQKASELLNKIDVDLIISDIMMPIKDGVALCHEVKNNVNTSHIPFIILSAKISVESKIEGADSGADAYFEKPIDTNLLKLSIENIFKHQDQLKEYYAKNYFADSAELSSNERDNKFLQDFVEIIERNIDQSDMDVNYIASELSMSRSKLYTKVKKMTDKSIVEFILSYRLRKAARLIIEEDMTMRQVMLYVGIESQAYFTNAFKKEFGKTPTAFAAGSKSK